MANPNKRKGSAFEKAVVVYLNENGYPLAERRVVGGANDRGDIAGLPGVVMELKNHKALTLAGWMDEAVKEAENDGGSLPVVVAKRRQKGVKEAYVVLRLEDFVNLLPDILDQ